MPDGYRLFWTPIADPESPTVADLDNAVDLTGYITSVTFGDSEPARIVADAETTVTFTAVDSAASLIREAARHAAPVRPGALGPGASAGDILDTIDAATCERCACGCRKRITDASPSAWFASAACQQRWNERNATNPRDVYNRADAAPYPGDIGSMRWRPDVVTADARPLDPLPVGVDEFLAVLSRFNATTGCDPNTRQYILRLDDGNRYVERVIDYGTLDGWLATNNTEAVNEAWQALDRQLGDTRLTEPPEHSPGHHVQRVWQRRLDHPAGWLSLDEVLSEIERHERREAAGWRGLQDRIEQRMRPGRRRPHVDQPHEGHTLVPFIGGPWHRDVRAIPTPPPDMWRVPVDMDPDDEAATHLARPPRFESPRYRVASYERRRVWIRTPWTLPTAREIDVYAYGPVTPREFDEAVEGYIRAERCHLERG